MTESVIILLEYTEIMLIKNMLMQKKKLFFYVILAPMSYGTRYLREEGDQNSEKIFYFEEKTLEFIGLNLSLYFEKLSLYFDICFMGDY